MHFIVSNIRFWSIEYNKIHLASFSFYIFVEDIFEPGVYFLSSSFVLFGLKNFD